MNKNYFEFGKSENTNSVLLLLLLVFVACFEGLTGQLLLNRETKRNASEKNV